MLSYEFWWARSSSTEGVGLRRESVSPPSAVKARCQELRTLASLLAEDFRWGFLAAYDRTTRNEAKVQASHSDPTGDLACDPTKQAMRRNLAKASRLIERSIANLDTAHKLVAGDPTGRKFIRGSLDALDPKSLDLHSTNRITRVDYAESVAAQGRRNGRGDGHGEG